MKGGIFMKTAVDISKRVMPFYGSRCDTSAEVWIQLLASFPNQQFTYMLFP